MSRVVPAAEPATLQGLATASLYLLSLVAAGSATLAWYPPAASAPWQAGAAVLLASALLSGESGAPARARLGHWMRSGFWTAQLVYVGAVALTLVSLFGPPTRSFLGKASFGFAIVQCLLLAATGADSHRALPLMNALLLVLLAAAAGGSVAAVTVSAFVPLLVAFLVFDHFARRLSLHRRGESGLVVVAVRAAALRAAAVGLLLAALFLAAPPSPLAGVVAGDGGLDPRELAEIHARLALIGMVGAFLVYLADRLRKRRDRRDPPSVERLVAERSAEEALEPEPERRVAGGSEARQRIVRSYAGVVRAAVAAGLTRRPGHTAGELSERIRATAGALVALTRLFDAARYGPREPTTADVRGAEELGRATMAELERLAPVRPREG